MRYDNGMLGVCLVVVALVASVGGAYVLSMDMEEVNVTKYNYVSDLTGIFESEKTVTYIEYEPSTNFTGYYTDPNTKYFSGVDYTSSTKTNNYRLNLAPVSSTNSTINLSTLTSEKTNPATIKIIYATNQNTTVECYPNYVTFNNFITQKNLGTSDVVKLSVNTSSIDWTSSSGGWFAFGWKSMEAVPGMSGSTLFNAYLFKNPTLTTAPIWGNSSHTYTWYKPILSAIYDGDSVELFYNADFTDSAGIFSPSETMIYYAAGSGSPTLTLSSSARLYAVDMPNASYMDVSKGVQMRG